MRESGELAKLPPRYAGKPRKLRLWVDAVEKGLVIDCEL